MLSGAVSYTDLQMYQEVWRKFDPRRQGSIPFNKARTMLLLFANTQSNNRPRNPASTIKPMTKKHRSIAGKSWFPTTSQPRLRTGFQEYISHGLFCKKWWSIVRVELRSLAVEYTIQQRIVDRETRRFQKSGMMYPDYTNDEHDVIMAEVLASPEDKLQLPFGELLATLVKWRSVLRCVLSPMVVRMMM